MDINKEFLRKYIPHNMEYFLYLSRLRQLQALSKEQILEAIKTACDFFNMPFPNVADTTGHPDYGTMFASSNRKSYDDDYICFDLQELAYLHITTYNALTLVLTHEATHRRTQMYDFPGPNKGSWAKECISDWYMGVRAGMCMMKDISNLMEGLGTSNGSDSHPAGFIRKAFIQNGFQTGYLNRSEHGANFEYFIKDFKAFYNQMFPTLEKEYPKYFDIIGRNFHKKTFNLNNNL